MNKSFKNANSTAFLSFKDNAHPLPVHRQALSYTSAPVNSPSIFQNNFSNSNMSKP